MLRLALIIVLIAATASAKHAKKEKRFNDVYESCYGRNSQLGQCRFTCFDTPITYSVVRSYRVNESKRILKIDDSFETMCSEVSDHLECKSDAIHNAPEICGPVYEVHHESEDNDKASSLHELFCRPDNIKKAKAYLECVADEDLINKVDRCRYANPGHNCTRFDGRYDPAEDEERSACYDELYRRNCEINEAVRCVKETVAAKCGDDSGTFVASAVKAFLEKFPLCPGDGPYKLNFFK